MMQTSETIDKLAAALAKAQGDVKGALKDSTNPHFRASYADLASVWDACRVPLTANGLSIIQAPGETGDGMITLTTMLAHASGQWIRETLTIPLAKVDAQGFGSALTYARRYALAAMVGVAPEDDDGNAATAAGPVRNDRQRPSRTGATLPAPEGNLMNDAPRQKPEKLTGKHKTRAAVRIVAGDIVRELRACGDPDMLTVCLRTYEEDLEQIKTEVPYYWDGDGTDTFPGMAKEIEMAWEQVTQKAEA